MTRHRLMLVVLALSGVAATVAASGAQARVPPRGAHAPIHAVRVHRVKGSTFTVAKTKHPICTIHSLPSFVETGLGATASSVADVLTVECQPSYSEDRVTLTSDELSTRCHGNVYWVDQTDHVVGGGPSAIVTLDNDGNATAAIFGGPSCAAGRSIISAHLGAPPFATADTTFQILAPQDTKPGVAALPSSEVEDSTTSSAVTIVYAEFPSVDAEQSITLRSDELNSRCAASVDWFGPEETVLGSGPSVTTTLDDNGNAFAVVFATPSCAAGKSQIEVSLNTAPFTSYLTSFNILSPRVTNP